MAPSTTVTDIAQLIARIDALESRVQALESARGGGTGGSRARGGSGASSAAGAGIVAEIDGAGWTTPYTRAELEVSETWIELHETSARPQLQRLLREVVNVEGPITDRLALDRIRRAWGLKRAGGRVQEAFDQALRQLVARGLVERAGDAVQEPGSELDRVRIPDAADEQSKRAAEDVPLVELAAAITRAAATLGTPVDEDELTMRIAKLFGWTRRGGAIQERLEAAAHLAVEQGGVTRANGVIRPVD